MPVRIVEGQKPYTAGPGIDIDANKVISLLLREENNLIYINDNDEAYVDLQLQSGLTPNSDFPVGVTVGKVLQSDGWTKSGLVLNWKTTSGDYARWIYATDGELYFDKGTGVRNQVYYSSEVDALLAELDSKIDEVADSIGDGQLTIQKNSTTVGTFTANQKLDTVVDIEVPSVIDNLTSTDTNNALSAYQGRVLKDMISSATGGLGRFLSLWNSSTGMPISFPLSIPYTYGTGDWFLVEVTGTTNYMPTGSSYTGTASTVVDSNTVEKGDVYIYDGNEWLLQKNTAVEVSFSNITGQPSDNTALASALNAKANDSNVVKLTGNQTVAGVKTFNASPSVPTPTNNSDAATKKYVDDSISAISITPSWGDITGTLSDQTDLQNALDAKANVTDVNTKTFTLPSSLSSQEAITVAQEAFDRHLNGKTPILRHGNRIYVCVGYSRSGGSAPSYWLDFNNVRIGTGTIDGEDYVYPSSVGEDIIRLTYDNSTNVVSQVENVYINKQFLPANSTTQVQYTPTRNRDPATKKYVDDTASSSASGKVSDTAYASSWNGVTGVAPSKNAVYDKISAMDTTIAGKQATLSAGTGISLTNNTVTNTGVTSFNGNTGAVTYTAPVTSVNGNTGAVTIDEPNTKTFYLSSTSDLTNAQAAYDWYKSGKNAIVVYEPDISEGNKISGIYVPADNQGSIANVLTLVSTRDGREQALVGFNEGGGLYRYSLNLNISNSTVTSISKTKKSIANFLSTTERNRAYTPTNDYHPATKKYVDDNSFSATNGGVKIFDMPSVNGNMAAIVEWLTGGGDVILRTISSNVETYYTVIEWDGTNRTIKAENSNGTSTVVYTITYSSAGVCTAVTNQSYSGGEVNVSTQANNILTSGMKIWAGTQANYEALSSYDSNCVYLTI